MLPSLATDELNTNLMDTWLVENDYKVLINLGESSVSDLRFEQLPATDEPYWLDQISLGNNSTWGSPRLRAAVVETYPGANADEVLVTAGVSEAMVAICAAQQQPGANLVIPVPAFHALIDVPRLFGFEVREIALSPADQFQLPTAEVIAAIDRHTRIVLLNSPHNPTGTVYSLEDIAAIADVAQRVDAIVVVDEHYRYLPGATTEAWIASATGLRDNVVTLGSVGKCFGCTGLRVGWILAKRERLARFHHYKLLLTHTISPISDRIAANLLTTREQLLPAIRAQIASNLQQLATLAARQGDRLQLYSPDAGSVAFVALPHINDTLAFAQQLLDDTGVLALPGESFELAGFLRLRLGIDPMVFAQACVGLEATLEHWHAANAVVPSTASSLPKETSHV